MAELSEQKQQAQQMWDGGDYGQIALQLSAAGNKAVTAAGLGPDDGVLDVACGTGNATIPAAQTGATVTGLDLAPGLLERAEAAAKEAGVEIEWIAGDAEKLPFGDGSFDAVISVFGCMFAPDHKAAATEIQRVLRPGGRMAICSWSPEGATGQFFTTVAKHMPPPPEGFQPPMLWGTEDHVRELFEGGGMELEFERAAVEFKADSIEDYVAHFETNLPPLVAARAALEPQGKWEALRQEMVDLYGGMNTSDAGDFRFDAEYLVAKGLRS